MRARGYFFAGLLGAAALHLQAGPTQDDAAPLVEGRLPAPTLLIALASAPTATQAATLTAALRTVAADSLQLGWLGPGCRQAGDAGPVCQGINAAAPLDDARRARFDAFLKRLEGNGERVGWTKASLRQAWSATRSTTPDLSCRIDHVLLLAPNGLQGASPPESPSATLRWHASAPDPLALARTIEAIKAQSATADLAFARALVHSPGFASGGAMVFGTYDQAAFWSGDLRATRPEDPSIAPWGRRPDGTPHTSASLLDAREPDTRVILTSRGAGDDRRGAPLRWSQLDASQQGALHDDGAGHADGQGESRLLYLRGERGAESAQGGAFRDRASRQADSLDSMPWWAPARAASASQTARPAMVYVATNGGMLHGFDAATGAERFAYVPQGVFGRLGALTRPAYRHQHLADGSPLTADVRIDGLWRHLLVGFGGSGTPGYFVLDVSDPAAAHDTLAQQLVLIDTTASTDPDLGRIATPPVQAQDHPQRAQQIARLQNGRWALLTGNGQGSTSGRTALLVQYLDGARELHKVVADGGAAGRGGLSAPRPMDSDGDGRVDRVYAGDLQGRLWRFDLSSPQPDRWQVGLDGQPLYAARDAEGRAQAISAAPLVLRHPRGGHMVLFGTGRLDAASQSADPQTLYGIRDRDAAGNAPAPPRGRTDLLRRQFEDTALADETGRTLWRLAATTTAPPANGAGWYLDLPLDGERVLAHPTAWDGALVDFHSVVPPLRAPAGASESCTPVHARHLRTTLHAFDGGQPATPLFGSEAAPVTAARADLGALPGAALQDGSSARRLASDGSATDDRRRPRRVLRQAGWRQIQ